MNYDITLSTDLGSGRGLSGLEAIPFSYGGCAV
jgi:hypothetical protein